MVLKGIKLVTFDATNTLLKFRVPPWEHYAVVARDHGFAGTPDDLKCRLLDSYKIMWSKYPNFGKSKINWENWWRQVVTLTFKGQLPGNANINCIADRLIEEFKTSKCWCTAEGCHKLVRLLRKSGMSIGVISNFDPRLNDILQNVQLHQNFDFIITSYEIGYSKPDRRIFKHALEKCNKSIDPSECIHIGDDVKKDYEGARAAGWHALLVGSKVQNEKPPAPQHVFSNLEDLSIAIEQNRLEIR